MFKLEKSFVNNVSEDHLEKIIFKYFTTHKNKIIEALNGFVSVGIYVDKESGDVVVGATDACFDLPNPDSEGNDFIMYLNAGRILKSDVINNDSYEILSNYGASPVGIRELRLKVTNGEDFNEVFSDFLVDEPRVWKELVTGLYPEGFIDEAAELNAAINELNADSESKSA